MRRRQMSGATAVAAVGVSDLTMKPVMSNEALAAQALKRALAECSLKKSEIDGLIVTSGAPGGVDYDKTAEVLGLKVQYTEQTWAHGRFSNPGLHNAAMAVYCGLAEVVACVSVFAFAKRKAAHGNIGGEGDHEAHRLGGGPHGESPTYGLAAPLGGAAMAWQKYLSRYGYTGEEAAELVLTQRENALRNPEAAMKKPLTKQDYLAAPYIIWPLRLLDCSLPTDGAVAVIVTTAERARDVCRQPAYITGISGINSARNEHSFGAPWLGIFQQHPQEPEIVSVPFQMAGIDRKDIDALQIYDAFLPQTVATIERFGFCEPGEALSFIQGGRIRLEGELPVNTSGGHLSEAHIGGWGQIAEAVRQIQGVCGARQIEQARHTIYAHGAGDCTIFAREPD
ncbi:MAG: thiolase family protein [Hyphomicrobiaceae bacterium]